MNTLTIARPWWACAFVPLGAIAALQCGRVQDEGRVDRPSSSIEPPPSSPEPEREASTRSFEDASTSPSPEIVDAAGYDGPHYYVDASNCLSRSAYSICDGVDYNAPGVAEFVVDCLNRLVRDTGFSFTLNQAGCIDDFFRYDDDRMVACVAELTSAIRWTCALPGIYGYGPPLHR